MRLVSKLRVGSAFEFLQQTALFLKLNFEVAVFTYPTFGTVYMPFFDRNISFATGGRQERFQDYHAACHLAVIQSHFSLKEQDPHMGSQAILVL